MKDTKYYLELPFTVILRRDQEGDFVARVDELPGCAAHGKTEAEALHNLMEAKELWIADCIESGDPVPEPIGEEPLPSGKWVQRVPRSLHRKLVLAAKREGVSLNQLVTSILSEAMGSRRAVELKLPSAEMHPLDFDWTDFRICGKWNISQGASPPVSVFLASSVVRPKNRLTWHWYGHRILANFLQNLGETEHALEKEKEHRVAG